MAAGIVVVQQYQRMVVQRFGTYVGTRGPGLRILIPILYHGTKVDLRERVTRVPTQKYITADNVVVDMDFVIYYRVMDDQVDRAVLEVQNFEAAVINLAFATLRSVIGSLDLATTLSERERIRDDVQIRMDEVTVRWGVKVSQVEINEVDPPPGVKAAMERQKSADAIRTAEITESEGQRQAANQPGGGRTPVRHPAGPGPARVGNPASRRRPAGPDSAGRGLQHRPGAHLQRRQHRGRPHHEPPVFRHPEVPGFQPLHQVHLPHGVHLHALPLPRHGRHEPSGRRRQR